MSLPLFPGAAPLRTTSREPILYRTDASRFGLGLILLGLIVTACSGKKEAPGSSSKAITAPTKVVAFGPLVVTNSDGSPFVPTKKFVGDGSGKAWEIPVGSVTSKGGKLSVQVGPLPGYDSVYDYVRLQGADGKSVQAEAEDPATSGDTYSSADGTPEHWWIQSYDAFSKGRGVLVRKTQGKAPVLTTTLTVPDGTYQLFIGSFQGDSSGPFAIGVRWE